MAEKVDIIEMKQITPEHVSARRQSFARHNVNVLSSSNMSGTVSKTLEETARLDTTTNTDPVDIPTAPFTWALLEEYKYSPYIKGFFRFVALVNIFSLAANATVYPEEFESPHDANRSDCEKTRMRKLIHYSCILGVDVILTILFSIQLFLRACNSRHWHRLRSRKNIRASTGRMRSRWLNYNHCIRLIPVTITTVGLFLSVGVHIYRITSCEMEECKSMMGKKFEVKCDIASALYVVFVLRVVTLVSAIKLFSPLKVSSTALQSLITTFRLKHLGNVTVFYCAVLYVYALIGVHVIGSLDYHCVSNTVESINISLRLCWDKEVHYNYNNDSKRCVSPSDLSLPDLHCDPLMNSNDYRCPAGTSCREIEISRDLGYYGNYDHLGLSLLSVYEVSTLELWAFQSYGAQYAGRNIHFYFLTIIFLLVIIVQQSIFLVVIIESFADVRSDSNLVIRSKPQPRPDFLLTDELQLTQHRRQDGKKSEVMEFVRKYWPKFSKAMILLVFCDAVVVAARGEDMEGYSNFVDKWEVAISVIFLLELIPYIMYYTPSVAVMRWQFWYLMFVAISSLVASIIIVEHKGYHNGIEGPMRFLVVFQALRFPRLTFLFKDIRDFFNDIIGKDKRIPIITIITAFFILGIAIIHFQLFSHTENALKDDNGYRSFIGAFRSTFQVVIGEGWSEVMSELMFHNEFWTVTNILFVLTHLVASLILLNLFVAIILDNLDKDEEKKSKELEVRARSSQDSIPLHLKAIEKVVPSVRTKVKVTGGFDVLDIDEAAVREYVQQGEQKLQDAVRQQLHMRKLSVCSAQDDDDDDDDGLIDETGTDKLQLINVNYGELLTLSKRRKSESVGQMVEKISMWRQWSENSETSEWLTPSFGHANSLSLLRHLSAHRSFSEDTTVPTQKYSKLEEYLKKRPYVNWSLFLFRHDNTFRQLCKLILEAKLNISLSTLSQDSKLKRILKNITFTILSIINQLPCFTWFMLFFTLGIVFVQLHHLQDLPNSAGPNSTGCNENETRLYENAVYRGLDCTFVLITLLELLLKAVAYGIFCGPRRVVHSVWDLISWVIVLSTIVVVAVDPVIPDTSAKAVLLFLWALRPIRIISIVPAMRQGIVDILKGKLNFLMAFILLGGFLFMFTSLGVQLFQGEFEFCNDFNCSVDNCMGEFEISLEVSPELIIQGCYSQEVKMLVPRVVVSRPREFGFDNFGIALLTMFEVLTLEGWITVRDFLMNYDDDLQRRLLVVYINVYLHVFVFFAVTIGLQLFVGIIVSSFNENKSEHSGLLTVSQKRWIDLLRRIQLTRPVKLPPEPEKNQWNYYPYKFLHGQWKNQWKYLFVLMIVLSSLLLSVPWQQIKNNNNIVIDEYLWLRVLYIIFQAFFVFIAGLSLVSDGYVFYFLSIRNTLEFFFAVASSVYIILAVVFEASDGNLIGISGITDFALGLAVVRLISALWKFNVLVNLFYTVIATIFNSIPLTGVLLVVFLHYGLVGTLLFRNVRTGKAINYSFVNFDDTTSSLWTMVRVLTGEDWHLIMHDCAVSCVSCDLEEVAEPYCSGCDCGSEVFSYIYFVSFYILIVFIFVNVFIAVLLESFSLFYNEDDSCLDLKDFIQVWSKFDRKAFGTISGPKVKLFLRCLKLEKFYTYFITDGIRERLKSSKKTHALLLREISLELSLDIRTDGQSSKWSQRVYAHDRDITSNDTSTIKFDHMLRTLAYRSEDIYKRLTPLELKAREEMEVDIQSRVAFECVKIWMEKYVKPILERLQRHEQIAEQQDIQDPHINVRVDVHPPAKESRPKRLHHRHSIVNNPEWFQSETEQDMLSDANSASTRHWLNSPAAVMMSDDRPELREHLRSHFKQPAGAPTTPAQSSLVHSSSYNSQFDWKQWYRQQVDSSDDEQAY